MPCREERSRWEDATFYEDTLIARCCQASLFTESTDLTRNARAWGDRSGQEREEICVSMRTLSLSRFSSHGFVCPTRRNRVKWDWSAREPSKNVTEDNGNRISREDILWTNLLTKSMIESSTTHHLLNEPTKFPWKSNASLSSTDRSSRFYLLARFFMLFSTRMISVLLRTPEARFPQTAILGNRLKGFLKAFSSIGSTIEQRSLILKGKSL